MIRSVYPVFILIACLTVCLTGCEPEVERAPRSGDERVDQGERAYDVTPPLDQRVSGEMSGELEDLSYLDASLDSSLDDSVGDQGGLSLIEGDPMSPAVDALTERILPLLTAEDIIENKQLGYRPSTREILIVVGPTLPLGELNSLLALGDDFSVYPELRLVVLRFNEDDDLYRASEQLFAHPQVSASFNVILGEMTLPQEWLQSMDFSAHERHRAAIMTRAPLAWNLIPTLQRHRVAPPTVGVVDSELIYKPRFSNVNLHDDLEDRLTPLDSNQGHQSQPTESHGTGVAGVIGARWDNNFGLHGLLPEVNMIGVEVGQIRSLSDVIRGLDSMCQRASMSGGPRVINFSIGLKLAEGCGHTRFDDGSLDMSSPGIVTLMNQVKTVFQNIPICAGSNPPLLIQASGNDSDPQTNNVRCPMDNVRGTCTARSQCNCGGDTPAMLTQENCADEEVCCPDTSLNLPEEQQGLGSELDGNVSAFLTQLPQFQSNGDHRLLVVEASSTRDPDNLFSVERRASYSNSVPSRSGVRNWSDFPRHAQNIFAPGGSSLAPYPVLTGLNQEIKGDEGTSFAAPMVSAAAAWLIHLDPSLSNREVVELLTSSSNTTPLPNTGRRSVPALNFFTSTLALAHVNPDRDLHGVNRLEFIYGSLFDVNDDTPDGFALSTFPLDPEAANRGASAAETGKRALPTLERVDYGDGKLNIRDFRSMRDRVSLYQRLAERGLSIFNANTVADYRLYEAEIDNGGATRLDLNHSGSTIDGDSGDREEFPLGTIGSHLFNFEPENNTPESRRGRIKIDWISPLRPNGVTRVMPQQAFFETLRAIEQRRGSDEMRFGYLEWTIDQLEQLFEGSVDVHINHRPLIADVLLDWDQLQIEFNYRQAMRSALQQHVNEQTITFSRGELEEGSALELDYLVFTLPEESPVVVSWSLLKEGQLVSGFESIDVEFTFDASTFKAGQNLYLQLDFCGGSQKSGEGCFSPEGLFVPRSAEHPKRFDLASGALRSPCSITQDLDIGLVAHFDGIPIEYEGRPMLAAAYPFQRQIRFFDLDRCEEDEALLIELPEGTPGPMALDVSPDGDLLVAALADPRSPCAAGGILLIDGVNLEVIGLESLSIGSSDVIFLDDGADLDIMAVTPGDDDCTQARHPIISLPAWQQYLQALEERLPEDPVPPSPLEYIVTPVSNGGRAHRITRSRDYRWGAWVTLHDDPILNFPGNGGRVGMIRASDRLHRLFEPEDFAPLLIPGDWPLIQDIGLINEGQGVRAYFVYERVNQPMRNHYNHNCDAGANLCSGIRFLFWDGEEAVLSGEGDLPYTAARRLVVSPDRNSVFVVHASGLFSRWDIGDGQFERFRWAQEIPEEGQGDGLPMYPLLPHLGSWGALYILDESGRF